MAKSAKDRRRMRIVEGLKTYYSCIGEASEFCRDELIEKAAFLKVESEEMEKDLNKNGWTELFQQTLSCEPYMRRRPIVEIYYMNLKEYRTTLKALDEMIPKGASVDKDELMEFLK